MQHPGGVHEVEGTGPERWIHQVGLDEVGAVVPKRREMPVGPVDAVAHVGSEDLAAEGVEPT